MGRQKNTKGSNIRPHMQPTISSATVANTRKLRALSRTERSKVENWRVRSMVRSLEGCDRSARRYSYEVCKAEAKAESIRSRNVSRNRNERGGKAALKHKIVVDADELRHLHSACGDHIDDEGFDNHGYLRPMRPCSPKLRMVNASRAQALQASASPASNRPPQSLESRQAAQNCRLARLGKPIRGRIVRDLQSICGIAASPSSCVWHSRRRSAIESLYNSLRGTSMARLGDTHKAAWWCSCGGTQPVFFATVVRAGGDSEPACSSSGSARLGPLALADQQQLDELLRRWEWAVLGLERPAEEPGEACTCVGADIPSAATSTPVDAASAVHPHPSGADLHVATGGSQYPPSLSGTVREGWSAILSLSSWPILQASC